MTVPTVSTGRRRACRRAAQKRERRPQKSSDESLAPPEQAGDPSSSTEELLARLEQLHVEYDAGGVSFDDFDAEKTTLLDAVALRLAQ